MAFIKQNTVVTDTKWSSFTLFVCCQEEILILVTTINKDKLVASLNVQERGKLTQIAGQHKERNRKEDAYKVFVAFNHHQICKSKTS